MYGWSASSSIEGIWSILVEQEQCMVLHALRKNLLKNKVLKSSFWSEKPAISVPKCCPFQCSWSCGHGIHFALRSSNCCYLRISGCVHYSYLPTSLQNEESISARQQESEASWRFSVLANLFNFCIPYRHMWYCSLLLQVLLCNCPSAVYNFGTVHSSVLCAFRFYSLVVFRWTATGISNSKSGRKAR